MVLQMKEVFHYWMVTERVWQIIRQVTPIGFLSVNVSIFWYWNTNLFKDCCWIKAVGCCSDSHYSGKLGRHWPRCLCFLIFISDIINNSSLAKFQNTSHVHLFGVYQWRIQEFLNGGRGCLSGVVEIWGSGDLFDAASYIFSWKVRSIDARKIFIGRGVSICVLSYNMYELHWHFALVYLVHS